MAFYNDAPGRKNQKKNYAAGSWADEGSQYSDRKEGSRAGSFRKNDDRRFEKRGDHKSFSGERKNFGDRKPYSNDRKPSYNGSERKYTPRPAPMEPKPAPSYRDSEFRPAPAAPSALEVMDTMVQENLLAGRNPIREALRAGRDIEKLLVLKGELSGSAREIVQMAREAHIVVQEVEKTRLDELAHNHQGLIAFASAYQYSTVEDMLAEAEKKGEDPFLILLDGVTDPHNLGAIIRSAECVGAHGVIVPERRSVGLTPAAVKASAGAVEHMKVARVVNLSRTIEELKAKNIWTYALTMDGVDYGKVNFKGGVALVVGSEGEGVSRLVLEHCDQKVSLPMAGHIDSLNASVAAGVMMYRVLASRKA